MSDVHRRQAVQVLSSFVDPLDYREIDVSAIDVENLVLEGGGCKCIAYAGMYKVLGDLGILSNLKRFAGTSIGALYAVMGAVGLTPEEIAEITIYKSIAPDSSALSLVPSVLINFGWNNGKPIGQVIRAILEDKTGNPDITFAQFYKETGRELCIVVTNVSSMRIEYCHVKTTPDLPIYKAVLMSTALPVVFEPITYSKDEHHEYYSDGGILMNYPIHAFDGWYLSMHRNHSFLHMIDNESAPFGESNNKSIGAILFDVEEPELSNENWIKWQNTIPKRPDTKCVRKRKQMLDKNSRITLERSKVSRAAKILLKILAASDKNQDGNIDIEEFKAALKDQDNDFKREHWIALFREERDIDVMFDDMDGNDDGFVTYEEVVWFVQKKGVTLLDGRKSFFACNEIESVGDFLSNVYNSIQLNTKALMTKRSDEDRTIPLYTDYIKTTDFNLEHEDKIYLMNLGYRGTIEFLKDRYPKS